MFHVEQKLRSASFYVMFHVEQYKNRKKPPKRTALHGFQGNVLAKQFNAPLYN